jgi:hypothetical protein
MATIELANGEVRSHETFELQSGYLFAYEGKDGLDYGEIERVYPIGAVMEIDPGESEIKGAPQPGNGMLFTPE